MDRLFALIVLAALLAYLPQNRAGEADAQPVFFSLLFPQLMPQPGEDALYDWLRGGEDAPGQEAVLL